jgi:hypothetical protein
MMATKGDFDDSKIEEKDHTCQMVNEEVTTSKTCPLCKEMKVGFDNLLHDSNTLSQKCTFIENQLLEIKNEYEKLQILNDKYFKTIQELQYSHLKMFEQHNIINEKQITNQLLECSKIHEDNVVLKEDILELKNDKTNSVKSIETFQNIKESQVLVFDKTSLDCRTFQKQKSCESFFVHHKYQKYKDINAHIVASMVILNPFVLRKISIEKNILIKNENSLRMFYKCTLIPKLPIRDQLIIIRRNLIRGITLTFKDPNHYGYQNHY